MEQTEAARVTFWRQADDLTNAGEFGVSFLDFEASLFAQQPHDSCDTPSPSLCVCVCPALVSHFGSMEILSLFLFPYSQFTVSFRRSIMS